MSDAPAAPARRSPWRWLRLLGPALLIVLLIQLDVQQVWAVLLRADRVWVTASTILILPLIAIKTVRWQGILQAQSLRYRFWPAYVAYFASLFIGFLTPGRLGEFTKALYVWRDGVSADAQPVSFARALSGVIADRIFDLGAVILVSLFALANLAVDAAAWLALLAVGVLLVAGSVLLRVCSVSGCAWARSAENHLPKTAGSLRCAWGWCRCAAVICWRQSCSLRWLMVYTLGNVICWRWR